MQPFKRTNNINTTDNKWKLWMPTLFIFILVLILLAIPSSYEEKLFEHTSREKVEILETDNSSIHTTGMIQQGEQTCEVLIKSGTFKGQKVTAINTLMGNLESDKVFKPGDIALAVLDLDTNEQVVENITLVDHYRLNWILWLSVGFVVFIVGFAGMIGLRSLLSFVLTILAIWKLLIPSLLWGINPIWMGLALTIFLTVAIIMLVYGWDKRTLSASLGSVLGTLLTALLSVIFVKAFKIHGAVMPFSESLLYSGYSYLDLTSIFTASIFIACSGAMMDVAVDITSAIDEIMKKAPQTSKREAVKSGLNVGRAVMGTMTTTLLLAYSGGFISLLMVFMAQGTPMINMINLKYVSSEILHTLIGSFGLLTVAPFTALTSGLFMGGVQVSDLNKKENCSDDRSDEVRSWSSEPNAS